MADCPFSYHFHQLHTHGFLGNHLPTSYERFDGGDIHYHRISKIYVAIVLVYERVLPNAKGESQRAAARFRQIKCGKATIVFPGISENNVKMLPAVIRRKPDECIPDFHQA